MKIIIHISFLIIVFCGSISISYAQENNTIDSIEKMFQDSIVTNNETIITQDTTPKIDKDVQAVIDVIEEINRRSNQIDGIHSEGTIFVNTKTIDEQEGSIEVRAKKPGEFWFRIWGSMIGISKDAFFVHFTRKKFLYYNNLNDYTIEGPTTDKNIGYIVKVKSTFDDILNVLTGTVYIPYALTDTLSMYDDNNNYYISINNKEYRRKYFVKKSDYSVSKYEYYTNRNQVEMSLAFGNYTRVGEASYSKLVEVKRPLNGETFRITNTLYQMNQGYLDFNIYVPNDPDIKRIKWDK